MRRYIGRRRLVVGQLAAPPSPAARLGQAPRAASTCRGTSAQLVARDVVGPSRATAASSASRSAALLARAGRRSGRRRARRAGRSTPPGGRLGDVARAPGLGAPAAPTPAARSGESAAGSARRAGRGPRAGGRRSSARRATRAAGAPPPRPRRRRDVVGVGLHRDLGARREERLEGSSSRSSRSGPSSDGVPPPTNTVWRAHRRRPALALPLLGTGATKRSSRRSRVPAVGRRGARPAVRRWPGAGRDRRGPPAPSRTRSSRSARRRTARGCRGGAGRGRRPPPPPRAGRRGGARRRRAHDRSLPSASSSSTARKASWGTSTVPICFMRFLPSFCFSRSLRLRLMSPP